MGTTITFLNQKGGVGKTSSVAHLSGTLARGGYRCLLLDCDPQASLTNGFFGPAETRALPPGRTVTALFDPEMEPFPSALIRPTGIEGVSIVPGSRSLADYNMMSRSGWADSEYGIRDFLDEAGSQFDLILADAPPNLHLCSWAALVGSHGICVPLQCEDYGAQGLEPVQESIASVRATRNPGLRLIGYLPTMFDKRLGIHTAYDSLLREEYGEDVFTNVMPMAKDFKEAVAARQPISHFKPKCAAAKAMKAIADELIDRITTRIIPIREVAA